MFGRDWRRTGRLSGEASRLGATAGAGACAAEASSTTGDDVGAALAVAPVGCTTTKEEPVRDNPAPIDDPGRDGDLDATAAGLSDSMTLLRSLRSTRLLD